MIHSLVLFSSMVLIGQGGWLAADSAAANITSLDFLVNRVGGPPDLWAAIYISVGVQAVIAQRFRDREISLLPVIAQSALLTLASLGGFEAMYESAFADGVVRSRGFLGADQMIIPLLMVTHWISLGWWAKEGSV